MKLAGKISKIPPKPLARPPAFPYNFFLPLSKGLFLRTTTEKIPKRILKSAEPESRRDICIKPDKLSETQSFKRSPMFDLDKLGWRE